jgi:alkanesulfonate monooxygenase SsuD/methylene tetrahydromethanopterin reductase-like flavin-dependent oxidoreductase (luciferase family)
MRFNLFLTSYYPDLAYGGKRHFDDLIAQAVLADRLGFDAVSLPEHHLINILMMPSPLQMAVKLAGLTENVELITAVAVLPLRDMRIFAGEVAQADMLCDGRLFLGVGRGAFGYEMARLGTPIEDSREKFDESLDVLQALLTGEEVSWSGKYYDFEPLTVMPRPMRPVPIVMAATSPAAIYHSAKRGFHIMTSALQGTLQAALEKTEAFGKAKAEMGAAGQHLRLALQRVAYAARDAADARDKLHRAYEYYARFDNVFSGPGQVSGGDIAVLPRRQTVEQLGEALLICPPSEMIERIGVYGEAGIDELILSSGMGQPQAETLEMMQRFAEDVMPHFTDPKPAHGAGAKVVA